MDPDFREFRDGHEKLPGIYCPINDNIFGLTEKQKELRKSVFDFTEKELEKSIDENSSLRQQIWRELGKLGLLGITIKEEYGGSGGCFLDQIIVEEMLARASAMTASFYSIHSVYGIYPINRYGTEEQKLKYLPKLCNGEHFGAMIKPDFQKNTNFKAVKQGDYYILNGTRLTTGCEATILVVFATTNPNIQYGISAFIVEKNSSEGLIFTENSSILLNLKVPVANMLGEKNKGAEIMRNCFEFEDTIMAGGTVGLMQALCDTVFEYTKTKKLFTEFKSKIAGMYTKLYASRCYLYRIARACDNGQIDYKDTNAVALYCTKNATELTDDAKKIFNENIDAAIKRLIGDMKLFLHCAGIKELRRELVSQKILLEYS